MFVFHCQGLAQKRGRRISISFPLLLSANGAFLIFELVRGHAPVDARAHDLFSALRAIKHLVIIALLRAGGSDLIFLDTLQFGVRMHLIR